MKMKYKQTFCAKNIICLNASVKEEIAYMFIILLVLKKWKWKYIKRKKKGKKNNENNGNENEYENSVAVFICEQEGCKAKYKYNFSSNKFTEVTPHENINHNISEDVPSYYKQNVDLLKEKPHITDIQLVRTGKLVLK